MDEIWERAVETALEGETNHAATRTLTLDGAVKCVQGKLPPPSLLEKFQNLHHLSIANIGVSSLEQFPRLPNLQKLILSDNRIAGGLEFLVEAGLESLRDLDLSNNRIQYIEDLAPLAQLRLVSLDLYECPVTRVKDYRSRVFGLIKSLKYLDKMDAEENERPESDDEEEEDEEEEDDPGSGEIDGEERMMNNGHSEAAEGIVDVDEDEESDADEEETESARRVHRPQQNGFRVAAVDGREVADEDEEGDDEDEENESGEEIDDEGDDDDNDVVEVHEIEDSDDEDGVEDEDSDSDDDDDEDEEDAEEVDNDEGDFAAPGSTGRLTSTEGEIDGHEHGEDDGDEDDNGETGEDEQGVEDDGGFDDEDEGEEEDEESGAGYLVQPVGPAEVHDAGGSYMEEGNDEDDDAEGEEEVENDDEVQVLPSSSSHLKRKRDEDVEGDEDDGGEDDEEDDDVVEYSKSSKKHH